MTNPEFIYTTYIKTTPEKLWRAITNPEFTRQYWGRENISDWKKGSKWQHVGPEAPRTANIVGEVLESAPPKRLVLSWALPADETDKSAHSRVTFEIEPVGDMICLTVTHDRLKPGSDMAGKIAKGWPRVLSSMKTFLETGTALDTWAGHTQECGQPAAKGAAA